MATITIRYNTTNSKHCAQDDVATYAGAHDATTSTVYTLTSGVNNILHNSYATGVYYVRRADLQFDTSVIPDEATITGAVLRMRTTSTGGANTNSDTVVALDNTNNANLAATLAGEDMNDFSTTSIGSTALSAYTNTNTDVDLTLTSYNCINKTGTTRIGLRLQKDIDNTTPSGSNILRCDLSIKCDLIVTFTVPDVKNDTDLSTNLVSYWKLEEASGTREDIHGTNDLTDNNTVGQATGKQGYGADFELSNSEYLNVVNASTLDIQNDFSLSFWASIETTTTPGSTYRIYTAYNGSSNVGRIEIYVEATTGKLGVLYYSSAGGTTRTIWKTTNAIFAAADTLYHIAISVDVSDVSTGVKVYRDGVSQAGAYTSTLATNLGSNTGDIAIGAYVGGADYYDGILDEFGVWSKLLSTGEVAALYNDGTGIPYDAGGGANTTNFFLMM